MTEDLEKFELPKDMTPEEKEAAGRRAMGGLPLMLAQKELTIATMKMTLEMTKGDFDAEAMMNRYLDAEEEFEKAVAKAREEFFTICFLASKPKDSTPYNRDQFVRRVNFHRNRRKSQERRQQLLRR